MALNRRSFLRSTAVASATCIAGRGLRAAESQPTSSYERANTDWLAKCRFGIGIHWTAQTVPRSGQPKPFQKAVADFDLDGFIKAVEHAGVNQTFLYATHQDYWAGEMVNLNTPAKSRYLDNGLQWFGWTCLEDRRWVHTKLETPIPSPLYTYEQVIAFVRQCNKHMAPMTFNVGIYQDGTMAPESVERLCRLNAALA